MPDNQTTDCESTVNAVDSKIRNDENVDTDNSQDEIIALDEFISDQAEKLQFKENLRLANDNADSSRPDESFFSKLDSSLKKNTAFVKKLKTITDSQKDALIRDFNALNLSRYVAECVSFAFVMPASALTEVKLKMLDVGCALCLCSLLHQRYSEFSTTFLDCWKRILLSAKNDKIQNMSKYRVDLRFFADLVSIHLFDSESEASALLLKQIGLLVGSDKEEHCNLNILISFLRHCGDDFLGVIPRKFKVMAEKYSKTLPRCSNPSEKHTTYLSLLTDYHDSLKTRLVKDHKALLKMEKANRRFIMNRGEVPQDRKEEYENALTTFEKLSTSASTFSDLLDVDMPELPKHAPIEDDDFNIDVFIVSGVKTDVDFDPNALFEDEDSRIFYESLPDLLELVPSILYKDSEPKQVADAVSEDKDNVPEEEDIAVEDLEKELEVEDVEETEEEFVDDVKEIEDEDTELSGGTVRIMMDNFVQSLPNCVNRELIDRAALDFCMNLNNKPNRRKLAKALFNVHRTRYDLLPFYARFVAQLHPLMPQVATDLEGMLKSDFRYHVRKKDQINIESKLKTVRFIGELIKFNMFPKRDGLNCLMTLFRDFYHHNIEMACALLETCGRFLFRTRETHHRTKVLLEIMMRKKAKLHMDSRYTTLIENAFFYSNPPDSPVTHHVELPPKEQYVHRLLYKDLNKVTTEKVLRQLRKMDWNDTETYEFLSTALTSAWLVRYNNIHCLASVIAGLSGYHEQLAIDTVDAVIEDIRMGMEINVPKYNQRRVSMVRFLGELYNYRLLDSVVIFRTLYSLITFGVSTLPGEVSPLDPPEHLFRIRLCCTLLDTCGSYFDVGASKRKLNSFLLYFQAYFWYKKSQPVWTETHPFPIDVDFVFHDTLERLRPKFKFAVDAEAAASSVRELENEYSQKIEEVVPHLKDVAEKGVSFQLHTITEGEEEDDNLSPDLQPRHIATDEEDEGTDGSLSQATDGDDTTLTSLDAVDSQFVRPSVKMHEKEDDDFLAAFDKMMAETIQARSQEAVRPHQSEINVPVNLKQQLLKNPPQQTSEQAELNRPAVHSAAEPKSSTFGLLVRKGNKQTMVELSIPSTAKFATRHKELEEAERLEKERRKQEILNIVQRQEQEDEHQETSNRNPPPNLNWERKPKYQPPRGAPDSDLIFGKKK